MKKVEVWKDVKGHEGVYMVSDYGNIRSLKSGKVKTLKKTKSKNRYSIKLSLNGMTKRRSISQLVAESFLGHIPCGYNLIVDHIDNNSLNNNLDNLQIITQRENLSKDKKSGSSNYTGVSWCKRKKKWRSTMYACGKKNHLGYFHNEIDAHESYQDKLKSILNDNK